MPTTPQSGGSPLSLTVKIPDFRLSNRLHLLINSSSTIILSNNEPKRVLITSLWMSVSRSSKSMVVLIPFQMGLLLRDLLLKIRAETALVGIPQALCTQSPRHGDVPPQSRWRMGSC